MPLHPDIESRLPLLAGIPSLDDAISNPEMRAKLEEFGAYPDASLPPMVPTRDVLLPGPHGSVPVRIYSPQGEPGQKRRAFVWMHGGAFMFGDLDMHEADWTARELAHRASAVIISVDYRLAGNGISYPVPLDDVTAAVRWVRANAEDLGIDAVSIGGASAGANLATGATLRLQDEDGWTPENLVLAYPFMHPDLPAPSASLTRALREIVPAMRPSGQMFESAWDHYLGAVRSNPPGYATPGAAALDRLGPTLVLNAEYDDLRASGEAFSASLAAAGVDVEQVMIRGVFHGFLNLPKALAPVDEALNRIASRLNPLG